MGVRRIVTNFINPFRRQKMTTKPIRGLERYYEYRERWKAIISDMEKSPTPNPALLALFRLFLENDEKTIDCAENNKPFLSSWYGNAPEIYAAMGIHYICVVDNLLAHQPFTDDLAGIDANIVPDDMCGLIKLGAYAVEKGLVPTPTGMIAMLEPCDAQSVLHESWINNDAWKDVPYFALDPAYRSGKEDFEYFAGELRRMIAFLENLTGIKLDWNRLREVIEETNRQYEIWDEYNQLRRAVPCPGGSFQGSGIGWAISQHIMAGHPGATELFRMLFADEESRYKANKGWLEKENSRVLWADLIGTVNAPIGEWLEKEHGTVVVQDFQGYTPYSHIDTSTEESMLLGLAKRNLAEVPMIRQARGNVDVFIEDVVRIVEDYKIDCVFFPGHVGHKDQSASVGFLREACRELGVPLLVLTMDIFDPRYLPMDKFTHIVNEFFETHKLGKFK
jgi:benzoyl-CoA reductase/2-hydroxyglutaryl-CoA dehydratase subunit BcrC/BadD/HgdB